MDGDPRVSKPRLPKAYTEEQLVFLRSHISGFETRTRGHVRGDAKKFALDRASEFLVRFGLPPDLQGVDEAEPRFREQIYNWYKNTVGRARRKLEGRTRPKKLSDKASTSGSLTWSPTLATSFASSADAPDATAGPSSHPRSHSHSHSHAHTTQQQQPQPGPSSQQLQFTFQTAVPLQVQVPSPSTIALNVTPSALRDAFVTHAIDPPTLSSLIQSFVASHPSPTPLTPVVHALFDAATSLLASSASASTSASASASGSGSASASTPNAPAHAQTDVLFALLRRFVDICAFFPNTLVHADVSGPLAGPRALQIALRKSSVWAPISTSTNSGTSASGTNAAHGSLSDEMERIKADRQRRKDYVQWAQIHAAAIELGIVGGASGDAGAGAGVGVGVTVGANGNTAYHHRPQELGYGVPPLPSTAVATDTFSEMMARDAAWEADEVEWVAGIIVLRAIIRTGGIGRKGEWEQLLGAYERRWKEIKDEARQALVTEVLLGARDDLARLDETRVT
ncbi:hypothetical protein J3R82DRAFT_6937 [Butyriboletus roseoflavus]|nr:hypothetical protein J3R82DRAFT_6937 [Butyriboletus roseoflavus]